MSVQLTSSERELRERAAQLAAAIEPYELACERDNGLDPGTLEKLKELVRTARLNAANVPTCYGGQGLNVLEQTIVEEQLGRLTNSLWAIVWRPANALVACSPLQKERYLVPAVEGTRRGAFADHRGRSRVGPDCDLDLGRGAAGRRLSPARNEVVRHVRRRRRLPHRSRPCPAVGGLRSLPRRQEPGGRAHR